MHERTHALTLARVRQHCLIIDVDKNSRQTAVRAQTHYFILIVDKFIDIIQIQIIHNFNNART